MPQYRYCVAPGCLNAVTPKGLNNHKGLMHNFPDEEKHPEKFQEWLRFCQRAPEWRPSSSSHICDDHFVGKKKTGKGTSVPTLPARMVSRRCENLDDLPANLPSLDTTLELFEDKFGTEQPSSFLTQTGLPADRTLDTTVLDFDADIVMTKDSFQSVDFSLANMDLDRIPSGWTLLLADGEIVVFAEIDKPNIRIKRFVGFKSDMGKYHFVFHNQPNSNSTQYSSMGQNTTARILMISSL